MAANRATASALDRLLEAAEGAMRMEGVIEILVLRARALQIKGDLAGALADLERALLLAEPEGYIRVFVDEGAPMVALIQAVSRRPSAIRLRPYIEQLLTAFGEKGHTAFPIQNLEEPLTERELEVLRLLAAGQSNAEIARTLVIAVSTVKTHTNNIFGKLGVTSRSQAIARARDLHLL